MLLTIQESFPIESIQPIASSTNLQLNIATFNLFNYLEPPNAYYEFERIYSAEQWQKKQNWITDYLTEHQPDIIGFQEVFSPDSLQKLVNSQGYDYFAVVDTPEIIDDFIYKRPVVAIASRYPIVDVIAVQASSAQIEALGLAPTFAFSRKVLRATINVPHLGQCDCYVVHFKSKRSTIEVNESEVDESEVDKDELDENNATPESPVKNAIEKSTYIEKSIVESLKAQAAGSWASSIQRGSEASLLMVNMIERRAATENPMVLMGDFNNSLQDGVLNHLLTNSLRFISPFDQQVYLAKYTLSDAWDLYERFVTNEIADDAVDAEKTQCAKAEATLQRAPTHYFNGKGSVLDYILLSCEFDASYHDSLYQVSNYHTYDRHLINPIFDRDGESTDHAVVMVSLALRI